MIIVRLRGGLGNQFFQYAAGRALADFHQTPLKLDLYYYKKHPYRKFELDKFNVPLEIATRDEVHAFTGKNPVIRFLNKYDNYFHCPEVFAQPHYHFYEDFFSLPGNLYLSGYWQSEKYFESIRSRIYEWYTPSKPIDERNLSIIQEMKSCASVSLHVRRGDYAGNSIFGSASEEYYKKAVDYIRQQVSNPHFFIFSDEIEWCRKNLTIDKATFIDWNKNDDSFKDLWLISNCKNHIMANSTFSWWGAWLDVNKSKIVVAPKKWFKNHYNTLRTPMYPARYYNSKDILPVEWITL